MVLLGVEPIIEKTAEEIKKAEEKLRARGRVQPLPFLPGKRNIYLFLRNGQSKANVVHEVVSSMEHGVKPQWGLSPCGEEQADRSGIRLELYLRKLPGVPVKIVSSPYSRAVQTAVHVGAPVGIKKGDIEIHDGLKERFFGSENEFSKQAHSVYGEAHKADKTSNGTAVPGTDGESANAVAQRFMDTINYLEQRYNGCIIVLSTHGDPATIGQTALLGKPISTHCEHPLANCELRFQTEKEGHHTHHAVDDLHDGHYIFSSCIPQ